MKSREIPAKSPQNPNHPSLTFPSQSRPPPQQHIAVAVEKATNDDLVAPKEKHVQHLLEVVRSGASVADVTFLVNYLNHQVTDCKRVTQMLKTHVLLHRLLLDSGEEFRTQIMKMHKWVVEDRNTDSTLKCLFSIRAWKDETSMEVSGWCRTYASYLDEFVANWEDFSDFARINKNPTGSETQMRSLPADELVRKLPICQLMMRRIIDCEAINDSLTANEVVIAATRLLFRDSFKWYHMCNDGVIRLIDLFFDMNKHHAAKALEMYKKATVQGDDLSRMYRNAEENWLAFRSEKFPVGRESARILPADHGGVRQERPGGG